MGSPLRYSKTLWQDNFASLATGSRPHTITITTLLTLKVGCEAGGEGDLKEAIKRDATHFHSEVWRRRLEVTAAFPSAGLTLHTNAPRHDNQLYIVNPPHTLNALKTCASVAFRVFSARVTPGNRGRMFSRFHPGEERHARVVRPVLQWATTQSVGIDSPNRNDLCGSWHPRLRELEWPVSGGYSSLLVWHLTWEAPAPCNSNTCYASTYHPHPPLHSDFISYCLSFVFNKKPDYSSLMFASVQMKTFFNFVFAVTAARQSIAL